VIQIKNLFKSFGDNKVLVDFSVDLIKGENLVVLGKSGSGKSVLIKCIIGLMKPDAGTINVLGQSVPDLNSGELDKMRVKVGFLFQSNALYDSMTVRQNLEFHLRRHWIKTSKEETNNLVMEVLSNVGLENTVDMMPAELSGGMRKRIALARTLILKPEIILYDEPTTGLDPITAKEISNLMVELQKKYHTSSIIITHDINCAEIVANRIAMLIDGKCYATGTLKELENSTDKKVKQFFE
jgi:phospholipid/cholesterol/gamma-HCH transport system ATP-binding protein